METIKKRNEFIASSQGDKFVTPSFIFLKHKLNGSIKNDPKIGYTASKKIGGAVMRNRAKRRMRFLVKEVLFDSAKPNTNYVIIARRKILEYPFSQMANDLKKII